MRRRVAEEKDGLGCSCPEGVRREAVSVAGKLRFLLLQWEREGGPGPVWGG